MKNQMLKTAFASCVLLAASLPAWAQGGPGFRRGADDQRMCLALMNSTPVEDLNSKEAEGLAYMREEEKLAHDVYAALSSKWNIRVFDNISRSEERHFSAIKMLLDRYDLPDPAAGSEAGTFKNPELQSLYTDLTGRGQQSLNAALKVGATIEDLNIHDLDNAIAATDNSDLKLVYQHLRQASTNHMRAFAGQLQSAGETYVPQYISQAAFTEIMSSRQGAGMGRRGQGRGGRGNGGNCPWAKPL